MVREEALPNIPTGFGNIISTSFPERLITYLYLYKYVYISIYIMQLQTYRYIHKIHLKTPDSCLSDFQTVTKGIVAPDLLQSVILMYSWTIPSKPLFAKLVLGVS